LELKRIIAAPMRIARGPLQQASLSRWAIWWPDGGDPAFTLLRAPYTSTEAHAWMRPSILHRRQFGRESASCYGRDRDVARD
jgi:hypothetical protein